MFVVDTDVLSYTSPSSRLSGDAAEAWREWVRANRDSLFLSTITLMEVRFGIQKLIHRGDERRALALRRWLLATETVHASRLIPVSAPIAHKASELLFTAASRGSRPSSEDALIAATAQVQGYRLLTRNARHMRAMDVETLNPLEGLPDR